MLTRLVDRMEQAGHVERVACPDDGRGTFTRLTPAGLDTLVRTAPTHAAGVARHFTDHVRDDELATVRTVLERILGGLRGPAG